GAKIEAQENNEWTVLHVAAQHGHEAIVRLLLDKGAKSLRNALQATADNGHEATVKPILAKKGTNED
ncbi:hypothetical protein BZA05DRAFT_336078, partial [Tricharina praecox]|uniref:uncharacterized protein n=1 Tax=Tricharina praecox TaxID=43433 RepID=UPI0022206454